jgi:hypothetical protein
MWIEAESNGTPRPLPTTPTAHAPSFLQEQGFIELRMAWPRFRALSDAEDGHDGACLKHAQK